MALKFSVSALLYFLVFTVSAEDSINLDSIVITGTKTERKLRDVPVRTELISRQQIEKTHARDLVDALRYQPGLMLKEIHGKSGTEVWLQGLDGDRVLVLIDGRPVSASTGSSVDLSQLAVSNVDHIEIVKGAVSALYGSSAMGGVVNIITRKPEKGIHYKLLADTGSWGDYNTGDSTDLSARHFLADVSSRSDNWIARATLDIRDSDGFDLDKATFSQEGDRGTKINLDLEIIREFEDGSEFSYRPSFYDENLKKNIGGSSAPGDARKNKNEDALRQTHRLTYDQTFFNELKLSSYLFIESFDDKTSQDVISTRDVEGKRDAELDMQKFEVQLDKPVNDDHLFTFGFVGFSAQLEQTHDGISETLPNLKHDNIEFYLQDDIFIGEFWEVLPGIRIQEDSDFGFHAAPKVNLMFSPQWFTEIEARIRLGFAKGYRVPSLKERGYIFDHSGIGYMVLGSEVDLIPVNETLVSMADAAQLNPELSEGIQVGFEMHQSNNFRFDLSLFYNEIKQLITTDLYEGDFYRGTNPVELDFAVYRYVNLELARTAGMDLVYSVQITPSLKTDISYSYLDAIDRKTGNKLTQRPDHQIKLGIDIDLPVIQSDLGIHYNWQSEEFTNGANTIESPSWHSLDIKLNFRLNQQIKFFAGIDNLTDEHKDPSNGGSDFRPEEGRFIYVGFMFND